MDVFVREFLSGDYRNLKLYLYDKNFRKEDLITQRDNLLYLYESNELPLNHRLNALTASSHKAMEALDEKGVMRSIELLEKSITDSTRIPVAKTLREDGRHIFFSMNTVLFHCFVFLSEFDRATEVAREVMKQAVSISESNLTEAFFQTCTNIVRCGVFLSLEELSNGNIKSSKLNFSDAQKVLAKGLLVSDASPTKYDEWFYAASTVNMLSKILTKYSSDNQNKIFSRYPIQSRIIRPHGEEKYTLMQSNILKYFQAKK